MVLTSFEQQFSPHSIVSAVFREELTLRSPRPVQFVDISLPSSKAGQDAEAEATLTYLATTFALRRPDLIVCVGGVAALFAQKYRQRLFPETPLLFSSVDQRFVDNGLLTKSDAAVAVAIDEQRIVENILQLLPDTTTLAVVIGASGIEEAWRKDFIYAFRSLTNRLRIIWFNNLSFEEMLKRSAALPPHSAIFFAHLGVDAHGIAQVEDRALPALRAIANAPIFGAYNRQLGHGIVGGPVLDLDELGRNTARVAGRMLQGESPPHPTMPAQRLSTPSFDAAELDRWHINDNRLPAGSVVLFRERSIWQRYRTPIVATVAIGLGETALIVALLILRIKRRRMERLLHESEARFRLLADSAPVMIWVSGEDKRCTDFNRAWLTFTGRPLEEEVGDGWAAGVHTEDIQECLRIYGDAFDRREPFHMEYRLRRFDGEYRWIHNAGVPRFAADGTFIGYTGSCMDITDQKVAKEALSNLSRRLIQAHEAERTWIARELHDDISQRFSMLIARFDDLVAQLPIANTMSHVTFADLSEKWRVLLADIGALSHRLHSTSLDYLGLRGAAAAVCRELSNQCGVTIRFQGDSIPDDLPPETSLALFRVLQEALTNAMKHSGAREVDVVLRGTDDLLDLSVIDDGCGFDPEDALPHSGLGLVSMRERLHLIKGNLTVHSRSGEGTRIHACVRVSAQTDSMVSLSTT